MRDKVQEFPKMKKICTGAQLWEDSGQPLVFLPGLKILSAGARHIVDALLCPRAYPGYPTRLFFSKPFPNRGQNWTVHSIMGRTWHVMSWSGVSEDLPWEEILANHLGPLQ